MKQIIFALLTLMSISASFNSSAQESGLLQKLTLLSEAELASLETQLTPDLKREAAVWEPGQFSFMTFTGMDKISKQKSASYLGSKIKLVVYKIDLSQIASQSLEETKTKLNLVFESVNGTDCILFFDEGDAFFEKRTGGKDSHARHKILQTKYFFDLVEKYGYPVIVSFAEQTKASSVLF